MTLTIEISADLENKLEVEAESKGIGQDEFVRIVLEEKLNIQTEQRKKTPFESKIIATDVPVQDHSREHKWLRENQDKFANQWVALNGKNLVASDVDAKVVAKKIRKLGLKRLFMTFVEASDQPPFISGDVW
jgi:hypothetical protein